MTTDTMTPQQVADHVREHMFARDRAAQHLGMQITAMGPGTATLTMIVRPEMLNGFDICHGGYITTLADTAFAYACNSYNELTVASGLSVDFVAPGRGGDGGRLPSVGSRWVRSPCGPPSANDPPQKGVVAGRTWFRTRAGQDVDALSSAPRTLLASAASHSQDKEPYVDLHVAPRLRRERMCCPCGCRLA